ncbi:MAG: elongation factor Ts [Bacteroidetes bacterium]|nr:MAG: elongation factor Ts [Bacteroidota bacterium]
MTKITAQEVNKLRQMTGAGMMDCKKALQESDGDIDKAIDYLRKKGQKLASKRADKSANEGIVIAKRTDDKTFGAMMMLNCETDFVAKNQDFIDFANRLIDKAIEAKSACISCFMGEKMDNGRTIEENITEMVGKTGEKLVLSQYKSISSDCVIAYNHHGNKLATLVGINMNTPEAEEAGHNTAMQVAAMNPVSIDKDGVPKDVLDREFEIGKEQARQEGKPENILDKIAEGRLNKFLKENTLLDQAYIKDNKVNVSQYLGSVSKELKVNQFERFMLGE